MKKTEDMKMDEKNTFTEKEIEDVFEDAERQKEAEDILNDKSKAEELIRKVIKSLDNIPVIGKYFSDVPTLCLLLNDYISKEYTAIPVASIITVIIALVYFISPVDLIPDFIPIIGKLDDAAVIALAVGAIHNDIADYKKYKNLESELADDYETLKDKMRKHRN